jgi:Xaa-Pro dipeptidase
MGGAVGLRLHAVRRTRTNEDGTLSGLGLAALSDGGRADFAAIRADRRRGLLDAMTAVDLDVLILGRPGDIAFATGVRSLFTSGSRPYFVGCVIVRAADHVHVLADYDDGVPAEIPHDQILGRAWNPLITYARVAEIPGLAEARRIGSAGTSTGVAALLAKLAPAAEVVDARRLVQAARARKSAAEAAVIEIACTLAEAGLTAMARELRPGMTTRRLAGRYCERLGQLGVTVVPDGLVASRTAGDVYGGLDDSPLAEGDLVSLSPSVTYGGYDATLARTVVVGGSPTPAVAKLRDRVVESLREVVTACVTGATGAELARRWASAGESPFGAPLAHGIGVGIEEPIIGTGLGADEVLTEGMVLAVQGWVRDEAVGSWLHREMLQVTAARPRLLTRAHPRAAPGTASTTSSPGAF